MTLNQSWNKSLSTNYNSFFDDYYYATVLFSMVISHKLKSGDDQYIVANKSFNKLKNNFKDNFKLKSLIKYFTIVCINTKKPEKNRAIIDISPRFNYLKSIVLSNFQNNYNYDVIDLYHSSKIIRLINRLPFIFFRKEIGNVLKNVTFSDFEFLLRDNNLMKRLDKLVQDEVNYMANLLVKKNVKFVFFTDGFQFHKLLIILAAKVKNIPCYEMFHGYHQSSFYSQLFFCNNLLVWNYEQKIKISNSVNKSKIQVFGYPGFDEKKINSMKRIYSQDPKRITYVSQPQSIKDKKNIYERLNILKLSGYKIFVRLHPKEVKSKEHKIIFKLTNEFGFEISTNLLEEDILKSKIILGRSTTVLYEALLINKNSLQIEEQTINNVHVYKQIASIKLDEIEKLKNDDFVNKVLGMNKREKLINDFNVKVRLLIDVSIRSRTDRDYPL